MATQRMLIDASHPEETRVAIVRGNHLEDFDVEVEARRQLRGNIYLAKVTRVEPSLQAAFVDYGGNRHGFLAFSEIHPDYYQIPVADRKKLLAEDKAEAEKLDGAEDAENRARDAAGVETVGGNDAEEVEVRRPMALRRKYKIQEVIKRRQILLVQVVKEERGTKGAALTTYLSLAGRYCVLMPNTARGGGISRKIGSGNDRKRLKSILGDLKIPDGMAVIVRTAGQKRSKAEVKRDYEYLMRVWNSVRDTTLESMAPCLVHEEANLIRRSIRDLYNKDIDEVIVAGDEGYRTAKDFMKLLIPSHTKRVQPFKETNKQLFQFYGIEDQLGAMHVPEVQLKSGGYIVLSPTEALVTIDVNSGRATRGRNIEETALKTNLEAADEIARQLRLRDLAGLIVIDFIDMEEHRNQVAVERRLKDAMRSDRARIQIGRISPFGLLELSRQRLRPSLIETSSEPCPYCEGTGIRRSTDTAALHVLRAIEDEGMQHRTSTLTVFIPSRVALYILNHHRQALSEIEAKFDMSVTLEADDTLIPPALRLERVKDGKVVDNAEAGDEASEEGGKRRRRRRGWRRRDDDEAIATEPADAAEAADDAEPADGEPDAADHEDDEAPPRGRRRRRGRRGGRRRSRRPAEQTAEDAQAGRAEAEAGGDEAVPEGANAEAAEDKSETANKRPAGGRGRKATGDDAKAEDAEGEAAGKDDGKGRSSRQRRPKKTAGKADEKADEKAHGVTARPDTGTGDAKAPETTKPTPEPEHTPAPVSRPTVVPVAAQADTAKTTVIEIGPGAEKSEKTARRGWWSREPN